MDNETKARIFEEGGKLASGLLTLFITRPKKASARTERPLLAPQKENVGKTSHEPENPPISASLGEAPMGEDKVLGGTAGNLCGDEHLTQAAGDLDEALRMARSRGIKDNEVRKRLKGARSELNQMERYDLVPTKVKTYPKEQQEIARWLLPKSSSLRHQINDILLRDRGIEDLENLTAACDKVSSELTDRIDKLPLEQRETDACIIYTERAKARDEAVTVPDLREWLEKREKGGKES